MAIDPTTWAWLHEVVQHIGFPDKLATWRCLWWVKAFASHLPALSRYHPACVLMFTNRDTRSINFSRGLVYRCIVLQAAVVTSGGWDEGLLWMWLQQKATRSSGGGGGGSGNSTATAAHAAAQLSIMFAACAPLLDKIRDDLYDMWCANWEKPEMGQQVPMGPGLVTWCSTRAEVWETRLKPFKKLKHM